MLDLAHEYWEGTMRAQPRWATLLGDHRFDDRLDDPLPAGKAAERRRLEDLLARLAGEAPANADARLTHASLRFQIESDLATLACPSEEWTIDPLEGPHVALFDLAADTDTSTPERGRAMVARWRAIGPWVDAILANLRRGLAAGRTSPRDAAAKVLAQLDETLATPVAAWPLLAPLATPRPDWSDRERARFERDLAAAVREAARPAFERLRAFVAEEALPRARGPERAGLCFLEGGDGFYRKLVRVHTSLDLSPDELHRTGLDEVARVRSEIESLGERLFGTRDLPGLRARIASDPALFFATRDEVRAKAEATLRRAQEAAPRFFGRLPKNPCVVKPMEPHEEKFSTIAFYRPPAADFSRPGAYMVNTWAPETRPRYEAQALAFHEAVPGHHLQIALAQELEGLPEFRKHMGSTAYVEGWALYAERLAGEMGLYDGDLDRLGELSYDAWRACRLVVDTGLHALGWPRARAIAYMLENTLLAANNVENEVDRYVVWPAQALAYKTGQLEILALRERARTRLGPRFELRAFHDVVLEAGALPLPLLRERVDDWLRTQPV